MSVDITLFSSPQTFFTRFPISSRILTSNLYNDKRFKIHEAPNIPTSFYTKSITELHEKFKPILHKIDEPYSIYADGWCGSNRNKQFGKFPIFYTYSGKYDNEMLSSLKTEIIFFTAYTVFDFRVLKVLLNDNRKVVVGGSSTFVYEPHLIRKYLIELGVDKEKMEKNLIIVRGYVDKTTDLFKIFEKWEDAVITENDFTSFWDCTEDIYMKHIKVYKKVFDTNIGGLLTAKCWWGKCKFCTYVCFPPYDFTKGVTAEKLFNHFHTIGENYRSKSIFFHDSYINPTEKSRKLFRMLSEDGFQLSFYTGIKLLSNPKYIEFINECNVDRIYVGLENTLDFCLKVIRKGYGSKEVFETIEVLKKYMNKSVTPVILAMIDLPLNSPSREQAIKDIKLNYRNLYNIRQDLASAGIGKGVGCQFSLAPFRHFPKTNMVDNNLYRYATKDQMRSDKLIGIFGLYEYLSEKLGIDISEVEKAKCLSEPLVRHLPNGELMESDMFHVDKEVIENLSRWKVPGE